MPGEAHATSRPSPSLAPGSDRAAPRPARCPAPFPSPGGRNSPPARGAVARTAPSARDGYAIAGTALSLARRALPERRQRSRGVRLQRLRLVRVRAARRPCAAHGRASSTGPAARSIAGSCVPGDLVFFNTNGAGRDRTSASRLAATSSCTRRAATGEVRVETAGRDATGRRRVRRSEADVMRGRELRLRESGARVRLRGGATADV